MNFKLVIAGAISGFVSALMIDLEVWSKGTPKGQKNVPFDFKIALKRYVAGGMAGGAAAAGWDITVDF